MLVCICKVSWDWGTGVRMPEVEQWVAGACGEDMRNAQGNHSFSSQLSQA